MPESETVDEPDQPIDTAGTIEPGAVRQNVWRGCMIKEKQNGKNTFDRRHDNRVRSIG